MGYNGSIDENVTAMLERYQYLSRMLRIWRANDYYRPVIAQRDCRFNGGIQGASIFGRTNAPP